MQREWQQSFCRKEAALLTAPFPEDWALLHPHCWVSHTWPLQQMGADNSFPCASEFTPSTGCWQKEQLDKQDSPHGESATAWPCPSPSTWLALLQPPDPSSFAFHS